MSMVANKRTVKLSTVIKNVVNITYKELDELITNMKAQTGTLRTQKLRQFCHRAMKRLAQVLALCKWLANPDVVVFLNDISTLQQHMHEIESELAKMCDVLYFTHAGLYSKRCNSLEVGSAEDLLARGQVTSLPKQMLLYPPDDSDKVAVWYDSVYKASATAASIDGDAMVVVDVDSAAAESKRALVRQLDSMIKAKAVYVEGMDIYNSSTFSVVVAEGLIEISVPGNFVLSLTLRYLAEDSPWKLVDFSLLTSSSAAEHLEQHVIYLEELKQHLVQSLTNACERDRAPVPAPTDNNSTGTTAASASAADADALVNVTAAGAPRKPTAGLNELLALCQYAATAVVLRYIFLQGLNYTRLIGQRHTEVNYYELTNVSVSATIAGGATQALYNSSVCRFKFWKDLSVEGGYRYIIVIKQIRNIADVVEHYKEHDVAVVLKQELSLVVDLSEQTGTADLNAERQEQGSNKPRTVPVHMFAPGGHTMYDIYAKGVSFQLFKDAVMELCTSTKLVYIYCYIKFLFTSHCEAVSKDSALGSGGFRPDMIRMDLFPSADAPSELHIVFNGGADVSGVEAVDMDTSRIVLAVDRSDGAFVLYTNNCCDSMAAADRLPLVHQLCEMLRYELNSNQNLTVKGAAGTTGIHANSRNYLYWLKADHPTEFGDDSDPETCNITRVSCVNTIENGNLFIRLTEFAYYVAPLPNTSDSVGSSGAIMSKYSNVKNSVLWCVLTLHECVTLR